MNIKKYLWYFDTKVLDSFTSCIFLILIVVGFLGNVSTKTILMSKPSSPTE